MSSKRISRLLPLLATVLGAAAAFGSVSFKAAVKYQVGTNPSAATTADFNGDGYFDLAVVNSGSNDVSILLGNADGTLQPAQNFPLNSSISLNPPTVVAGDFNGDGKPDLAVFIPTVAGTPAGEVCILIGNGDGTLQAPIVTPINLAAYYGAAVVDVNGDKKADLIVSLFDPNNPGALSLNVLMGKGDGTFLSPKPIVTGSQLLVAIADFNKDGKPDLGVNDEGGPQTLIGNGDGTFRVGTSVKAADGLTTTNVWAADLNGDGNTDLIVQSGSCEGPNCSVTTQHLSVFLSNGGTFGSQQIFFEGGSDRIDGFGPMDIITNLVAGDFDGDGLVDIADRRSSSSQGETLEVRLGKGDGTFAPNNATFDPTLSLPDVGPLWIAQDLNGDQLTDLVVPDSTSGNSIAVILNATPAFSITPSAMALNVAGGQQVTDTLSIAAHNGFSSAIHLSCQLSGPAPLPTCSVSPPDIEAGTTASTSMLAIEVPATSAGIRSFRDGGGRWQFCALALPFALVIGFTCFPSKRRIKARMYAISLVVGVMICGSCGGGGGRRTSTPSAKAYTVTVTASSDSLMKTVPISLTTK